ncbi:homeobox protein HoxA/C/D13 [Sarotherodon galilaeus]
MRYRIRKRRELGESQAREETVESTLCRHSRYRSVVPPPYPTQSCSTAKCEGREREGGGGGEGVPHCRYESKWSAPDAAPPAGAPGAPGAPGADGAPAGAPPAPPNTTSNRRLQQTQAQVEEVVDIMRVNVDKVLERDQKLSELDDRADALQAGASQFESCAAKLKNKYWWKNCKMMIMMGIIGVIVVGIIFCK